MPTDPTIPKGTTPAVHDSSGCVWRDLNLPCKTEGCRVCALAPMTTQTDSTRRELAWLAEPRLILSRSHWWPRIREWQRAGLVRLEWRGSSCFVVATDKGKEMDNA